MANTEVNQALTASSRAKAGNCKEKASWTWIRDTGFFRCISIALAWLVDSLRRSGHEQSRGSCEVSTGQGSLLHIAELVMTRERGPTASICHGGESCEQGKGIFAKTGYYRIIQHFRWVGIVETQQSNNPRSLGQKQETRLCRTRTLEIARYKLSELKMLKQRGPSQMRCSCTII